VLPKPLMPIGDRSILEIVLRRLADQGFFDISICVGYLSHLIRAMLAHMAPTGAQITFVQEREALGTAGPLRLIEGVDDTFMAMNGDILTTLDFRELLAHHKSSGKLLTVATHRRTVNIDYGVVYLSGSQANGSLLGGNVIAFEEKPEIATTVSMGVYVMEPEALEYIPPGQHFDFPDLVHALLIEQAPVGAYTFDGLWFDIGRQDDYERAVTAWLADEERVVPAPDAQALIVESRA
jgi:NDP-sugar pyrophosphorylase family protein